MLHSPLVVGAEPAGTGRASLPLTCPPFLPLCSSSLSLTPESWTGEKGAGQGDKGLRVRGGAGWKRPGCGPARCPARACPCGHTGGHVVELPPYLGAPSPSWNLLGLRRSHQWGAEPGPSGPPRPRPAVWKHLLQSAGPGSHGPSDTLPLTPSRRREGPPPLRSSPSPAPRR